jgi:CRP-like cAMP-binding protein
MSAAAKKEKACVREDVLAFLPRKDILEYQRNQTVYDEQNPTSGLSLIIEGRVKVTTTIEDGTAAVVGIFGAEEFFGELVLIGRHDSHRERATAMENTTLMSWSAEEIEAQIASQPKLGLALIQILVGRCLDLEERLQSLAFDKTLERVAWGLIRFTKLGTRQRDGSVSIPPLTHQFLSEYLGTSREMVTSNMNELRRLGFLRYSRKAIEIYPEALTQHLRSQRRVRDHGVGTVARTLGEHSKTA